MRPIPVPNKKEIAVVWACSALLMMNLGAVGSGGRRRAKEAVCLSNLRQWGVIFETFTNNNDGCFMEGFAGVSPNGNNRWIKALGVYHNYDTSLSCCPEAAVPAHDDYANCTASVSNATYLAWGHCLRDGWLRPMKGSYGINGYCNDPDPGRGYGGTPEEYHWRTPNVENAACIPLLLGAQWYNAWPMHVDRPPAYEGQTWREGTDMARFCMNRHNGAVNSLFLDFSARKVGLKELWTLKWHRGYDTEGPWTKAGGVEPEDWPEWMRNFKKY
ncbi:MAG: hypothetical protein JSU70_00045 [Phycisphaerales bacterium]|nr:MAG: hypothetical protein JSU70_00045 [Phycisphaerales bacterium]